MLVRDKEYLIVREVSKTSQSTQYIFKNTSSEDFYKVLVQDKSSINGDLIKYLSKLPQNKAFTDFVDYMNDFEHLYVFMKFSESQTLENKLNTELCTLEARLDIAKKILEKIIILDIPAYFTGCTLNVENVLISKTGDIFFDYDLTDISNAFRAKEAQSIKKLAEIFNFMFKKELSDEIMPEMQTLIYNMEYGEITKIKLVFERFYSIYKKEDPTSEANALREKIVEKFKKFLLKLAFMLKIIIVAMALFYLFSAVEAYNEHEFKQNFTQIGTFDV